VPNCQSIDAATCSLNRIQTNGLKSAKNNIYDHRYSSFGYHSFCCILDLVALRISGPTSRAEDLSYPLTFIKFQKLNFSINNDIVDCEIGKGCFGVVYKADMPHGELIATKSQILG